MRSLPQFTQPRNLQSSSSGTSSTTVAGPPRENHKFTIKRTLDEEAEGRTIAAGSRWKIKGSSTKVVPIKLPVSPPITHKTFSHSQLSEGTTESPAAGGHGFYRYHGTNPSQSLSSQSSQWQHARVQPPGGGSQSPPCLSLAELPHRQRSATTKTRPRGSRARAESESSEDLPKSRTLQPSDDSSDHDRDFEIERDNSDGGNDDDEDDDSSVKVEVGGYLTQKKSRRTGHHHHRSVDLGTITLDCD
jgi:hypothetical protein